jgi:hypothetical protein
MATRKSPPSKAAPVVRRSRDDRKRLPADLEAFARGDEGRYRPERPDRPRLQDPRPSATIAGVRNLDARDFHDRRVETMEALLPSLSDESASAADDRDHLGRLLAEAILTGQHRGRSFVSFDAFVDVALGIAPARARELAKRGVVQLGLGVDQLRQLSDETVAVFVRCETALTDKELPGKVSIVIDSNGTERIRVEVDSNRAAQVLYAVGGRLSQLAADQDNKGGSAPKDYKDKGGASGPNPRSRRT